MTPKPVEAFLAKKTKDLVTGVQRVMPMFCFHILTSYFEQPKDLSPAS